MEFDPQKQVAVLIPAYNPDGRLLELVNRLRETFSRIVVVDDGSVSGGETFAQVEPLVEKVLRHPVNRGKGAAIKTGLAWLGACDVVTADADGQHRPEDIVRVAAALREHRGGLTLGVRAFSGHVPFRSRFGNFWTRLFFFVMTRLWVRDTQTGLRGIPAGLVARVAALPGERYEYEMAMLADARRHAMRPFEVPIATVYVENNATSHFQPFLDTVRIYRSLLAFCLSSVLSFAVDNALFAVVIAAMTPRATPRQEDILVALAVARFVSANLNFFLNRQMVFARNGAGRPTVLWRSYFGYWALVLAIAAASWALTSGVAEAVDARGIWITAVKIVVETVLFVASYAIQKRFIFANRP